MSIDIKDIKKIRVIKDGGVNVGAIEQQDLHIPKEKILDVVRIEKENTPHLQFLDGFTVTFVADNNKTYTGIHVPSSELGKNYEVIMMNGGTRKRHRCRTRKTHRKRRSNSRKIR